MRGGPPATKAGVPGRILHDFRRTAIRNLERAGVPRSAAMKMVGHKTESVYRRYAIADEGMLRESALKLAAFHQTERSAAAPSLCPSLTPPGEHGHGSGKVEAESADGAGVAVREVRDAKEKKWWTGGELNSRHRDFQSRALPTELPVHRARREPPEAPVTLPDGPGAVQSTHQGRQRRRRVTSTRARSSFRLNGFTM